MIVIGNGESRQHVNIDNLPGIKVGCNAIHRDFDVDHLVCVDHTPLREALASGLNSTIWTRAEYAVPPCCPLPEIPQGNQRADQERNWGSGPYAILLAAQLSNNIHILGFDLHSKTNLVNNVYKGTLGYSSKDSHAVDPRYWVYQIRRIFLTYPDKYFIVYNNEDWTLPKEWYLANVELKTLDSIYFVV